MSGSLPHAAEWVRVAATDEIGSSPVPVSAGGGDFVLVRLHTGGPPAVFAAHCPHRLVPLAAAKIVDGTLQCAYHGWRFGPDGRCVAVPSLGDDAHVPGSSPVQLLTSPRFCRTAPACIRPARRSRYFPVCSASSYKGRASAARPSITASSPSPTVALAASWRFPRPMQRSLARPGSPPRPRGGRSAAGTKPGSGWARAAHWVPQVSEDDERLLSEA